MTLNMQDGKAYVRGYHPILYVPEMDTPKGEELMVLRFDNRDSREPVTFGTPICLQNSSGSFLSFNSSGEVKFDKNNGYDQFESSIAKLTKWVIIDPKNPKNTNVVTPFDDIMLRQPFGQYLQIVNT